MLSASETKSYELKYSFQTPHANALLCWLSCRCQKDHEYNKNIVSSIYYVTANWDALAEKINSDYLKNKIRLRWCRDTASSAVLLGAYLESKANKHLQLTSSKFLGVQPKFKNINIGWRCFCRYYALASARAFAFTMSM